MARYANGPHITVEIEIDAPPALVWQIVTDINSPAEFSREFQGAEWIDDGDGPAGPALGARFRGHNKHKIVGEWSAECVITEFDEESVFEWSIGDLDNVSARWRFGLAPTVDKTRTVLEFTGQIGPGRSGLTPAIESMPDREEEIVARRLGEHEANMMLTVEGIKGLAERQAHA